MHTYLPSQPRKAIWYFVIAYWIITLLGILLTVAFAAVFKPSSPQELGVPLTQAPAYLITLSCLWHDHHEEAYLGGSIYVCGYCQKI
jgi:hypothetical protein